MKKLPLLFIMLLFAASCVIVSCSDKESLEPSLSSESGSIAKTDLVITRSMLPYKIVDDKSKSGAGLRTNKISQDYGPFTATSTRTRVNSGIGSAGYWKNLLVGFPQYVTGLYFCDVYVHTVKIVIPSQATLIFQGATNYGYPGNANPVYANADPGFYPSNPVYGPNGKTYYFYTYGVVPRIIGQTNVNSGQVALPTNFSSTTVTYSYSM